MLRRCETYGELPLHHPERQRSQSDLPQLHVFEDAVRKEITGVKDQPELFLRTTSELTTLLRDISHEHGRSYFRYVLRDVFGDKSTFYDGSISHDQIITYAQSVVQRLARAIHYAPLVLRACTQFVLREFQQSFPACKTSEQIVVGRVLFLRVLCPALIKPEVFGYKPHSTKTLPVGVQIAKLLQLTLSGSMCSSNQPEGVASNEFINTFHPFVETFLSRFPQISEVNPQNCLPRRPMPLTRVASWEQVGPFSPKSALESPVSCRGRVRPVPDIATRLRGMSVSTPEDMKQRKKKFSLKFWH